MNKLTRMGAQSPAVSIKNNVYAMATTDGLSAEIAMYGDIYDQQPTNWWGEPVEGHFILLQDFLDDLEQIANCKNITIRMHSYGGDAGVSIVIHNRLRDLASKGVKLTCIVDGVAMSGGSLIMSACDIVMVNPSSLVMIHKCWSYFWGTYNADELRSAADQNDAWDRTQISIYQRKTGLSETVLAHMMSATTYMTGKEAVEKGFADEVIDDAAPAKISASADGRSLFVSGHQVHMAPGCFAPDFIPTQAATEEPFSVETNTKPETGEKNEGGKKTMTLDEFRAQNPEMVEQVEAAAKATASADAAAAAVKTEQDRLQAIDAIADLFDPALVAEAKYGEKACSVQELTYRAAQQAKKLGHAFMADAKADTKDANAADVSAAPGNDDSLVDDEGNLSPEARMESARAEVKVLLGKNNKEE